MTEAGTADTRRGRRTLLIVALLFLLPVLLSAYLYVTGWRPQGRSLQYGELLQPARPLGDARLVRPDGTALQFSELRGKWLLVSFGRLPCTPACRDNLYKLQQVRLAQGRDATRVQRVFVLLDPATGDALGRLADDYPGLIALRGERGTVSRLAQEFSGRPGTPPDGAERIYMVDPHGNLVMRYAPDADASGLRKDLARLLRLSQIG